MKRIAILTAVALALVLMTSVTFAGPRFSVIHMTRNFNKSLFPAECLGTVTTETLPSKAGEQVTWLIRNGNSFNNDDVCPSIDKSMVALQFKDGVMGATSLAAQQITLGGVTVWVIRGTISAVNGTHQYSVFYKGLQAGPDPELDVACPDCGGPGPH